MGDDKTANMMKFALLALALSAIATQAASYDKVDAVVPEELVEDPAPAPAAKKLSTCTKQSCEAFWTKAAVWCHKQEDVAGCHTTAWKKCVAMNGGKVHCCGHDDSCDHLPSQDLAKKTTAKKAKAKKTTAKKTTATCTKQSCEAFWTKAAVWCHKQEDVAGCHTTAWKKCVAMNGGKVHCC